MSSLHLKQNEQRIIFDLDSVSDSGVVDFYVLTGSRILVTLLVESLDVGATIDIFLEDSISVDDPYQGVVGMSANTTGQFKRVASDFNQRLRVRYVTAGGAVSAKVAVILFDNASTTRIENASLRVDIDHTADSTGHFDSIRVGDGTDLLAINSDGSINTNEDLALDETPVNVYGESAAALTGVDTAVLTYTVPADKIAFLYRAEGAGENIAKYQVHVNGSAIATRRTYFGGDLTTTFEFGSPNKRQQVLQPGDIIEVKAVHNRPDSGSFEARLQLLLKDAP